MCTLPPTIKLDVGRQSGGKLVITEAQELERTKPETEHNRPTCEQMDVIG